MKRHRILFAWEYSSHHHTSRCQATAQLIPFSEVTIFSLSGRSRTYSFYNSSKENFDSPNGNFEIFTFTDVEVEELKFVQRLKGYLRRIWFFDAEDFFLCHYEKPEVFLTALILRMRGKRVFVMNDSKLDDYPRQSWREFLKSILYLPYNGALVSGSRSAKYLRSLGVNGPIETGYDTIDVAHTFSLSQLSPPISLPPHYFR